MSVGKREGAHEHDRANNKGGIGKRRSDWPHAAAESGGARGAAIAADSR
jgi:hypothetical protein